MQGRILLYAPYSPSNHPPQHLFFLIFHTQLSVQKIFGKDKTKNMNLFNQGYTGSVYKKYKTFEKQISMLNLVKWSNFHIFEDSILLMQQNCIAPSCLIFSCSLSYTLHANGNEKRFSASTEIYNLINLMAAQYPVNTVNVITRVQNHCSAPIRRRCKQQLQCSVCVHSSHILMSQFGYSRKQI